MHFMQHTKTSLSARKRTLRHALTRLDTLRPPQVIPETAPANKAGDRVELSNAGGRTGATEARPPFPSGRPFHSFPPPVSLRPFPSRRPFLSGRRDAALPPPTSASELPPPSGRSLPLPLRYSALAPPPSLSRPRNPDLPPFGRRPAGGAGRHGRPPERRARAALPHGLPGALCAERGAEQRQRGQRARRGARSPEPAPAPRTRTRPCARSPEPARRNAFLPRLWQSCLK